MAIRDTLAHPVGRIQTLKSIWPIALKDRTTFVNASMSLLTVHYSRRLRVAMATLHLIALAAIWLADLPCWLSQVLTGLVGISLFMALREGTPVTLSCQPDGTLTIGAGDDARTATVLPDSLVWSWLVVIRYRLDGQRWGRAMLVLPDGLAEEDFRCLRVWLNWRASVVG